MKLQQVHADVGNETHLVRRRIQAKPNKSRKRAADR